MARIRLLVLCGISLFFAACGSTRKTSADYYDGPPPRFENGMAFAPRRAPKAVHRAMAAANAIQGLPYQYGGGHGRPGDRGMDCSGAVSHVLRSAGLMRGSTTSSGFKHYGKRGAGKWITVFAKDGHVFMTICGLRFDTGTRNGGEGPRWHLRPRSTGGFTVRHPAGL